MYRITGTAAVAVAGLYASTRITKKRLEEYTFLFQGAGSVSCLLFHGIFSNYIILDVIGAVL